MPERVVNFSLRSEGVAELDFVPDIFLPDRSNPRIGKSKTTGWNRRYNFQALRNEVTAKNRNNRATAMAIPTSQRAASCVQARRAAFSQANARTAKTAPVTSWKSWRSVR